MKTLIPATDGTREHWQVRFPDSTIEITYEQLPNRSRLDWYFLTGSPESGADSISQPGMVAFTLPKGNWQYSTSDNGMKWRRKDVHTSDGTGAQAINFILDGAPFPARWGRFVRQVE
jgi:hypothetical protein